MAKLKCQRCGYRRRTTPEDHEIIRMIKRKYPCIVQRDLAKLFGLSNSRINEIVKEAEGG